MHYYERDQDVEGRTFQDTRCEALKGIRRDQDIKVKTHFQSRPRYGAIYCVLSSVYAFNTTVYIFS